MDRRSVAPYMGAWIEICYTVICYYPVKVAPYMGAWIEIVYPVSVAISALVAPYMGAWIEIWSVSTSSTSSSCRSLHGSVD